MMNRCGLTDTEHMLGDSPEISDEKGAASQMKDQNDGHGEGLLPTNQQGNEVQGNEVQGNEVQGNEVHKERDDYTSNSPCTSNSSSPATPPRSHPGPATTAQD